MFGLRPGERDDSQVKAGRGSGKVMQGESRLIIKSEDNHESSQFSDDLLSSPILLSLETVSTVRGSVSKRR
jgi:hypothetical protein